MHKKILVSVKFLFVTVEMTGVVIPTPGVVGSGRIEWRRCYGLQDLAEWVPRQMRVMSRIPFFGGIINRLLGVLPGPPYFIFIDRKKNGVRDPDIDNINLDAIFILLLQIGGGYRFLVTHSFHQYNICLNSYLKLSLSFYFSTFHFFLFDTM